MYSSGLNLTAALLVGRNSTSEDWTLNLIETLKTTFMHVYNNYVPLFCHSERSEESPTNQGHSMLGGILRRFTPQNDRVAQSEHIFDNSYRTNLKKVFWPKHP